MDPVVSLIRDIEGRAGVQERIGRLEAADVPEGGGAGISGAGASGRLVIWSSATNVTSDPGLTYVIADDTLFIDGSSDNIRLRLQGHSSQTSAITTWEKSTGLVIAKMVENAGVYAGTGAALVLRDGLDVDEVRLFCRDSADDGDQLGLTGHYSAGGHRYIRMTIIPVGTPSEGGGFQTFADGAQTQWTNWATNTTEAFIAPRSNLDRFVIKAGHLASDSNSLFFKPSTGQLSIGTSLSSVATAQFDINITNSARVGQIITAAASQSVNTLLIQDSAAGQLFAVSAIGHGAFGTSAPSATVVLRTTKTFSSFAVSTRAIVADTTVTAAANSAANFIGVSSEPTLDQNGFNATAARGLIGIQNKATASGASGTITGAVGGSYQVVNTGAGTITNAYGGYFLSNANTGGGTLTNNYGIFIDDQDAGSSTNFAILTNAGNIVFNEGGDANTDVRMESDSRTHMFFLDASANTLGVNQSAPVARFHITESTLGNEVLRLESTATNDDPRESVYQNRVATTNATQTTIHTFTVPATTTYMIEAYVTARRTGGSSGTAEDGAGYVIRGTYKNVAGTATLIGAVNASYTAEDQAGWDATLNVTGATVLCQVTGAANNNVTWHLTARVWQLSS